MAELKTKPAGQSVAAFVGKLDARGRADAAELVSVIEQVTGAPAMVWGSGLIGAGAYHYRYASGHEGDWFELGFAPRKGKMTLYLSSLVDGRADILKRLGKHKVAGGCVHIAKLADVDRAVLGEALAGHVRQLRAHVAKERAAGSGAKASKAATAGKGTQAAASKKATRKKASSSKSRKPAAPKKATG